MRKDTRKPFWITGWTVTPSISRVSKRGGTGLKIRIRRVVYTR